MNFYEKIVKDICIRNNITFESFCDDYCLKLSKNGKQTYIYDNIFENNNSSIYKILKDKTAVYEILSKNNIPCVEHFFYTKHNVEAENIKQLNEYLTKYKKLVLKNYEGQSGIDVFYIDNLSDLISVSNNLILKYNSLSISPFYEIDHEYRVVIFNDEIQVVFDKIRPFVIGNGIATIQDLFLEKYGKTKINIDKNININYIPKNNEKIILNWKHNLNFGAIPEIIKDINILNELNLITQKITKLLNINYASIDIIKSNGKYFVLEINGSVTLSKFASFSKENYETAYNIYQKVIFHNLKKMD